MENLNHGKKNIISLTGRPGSGKSTTSKAIAEMLGYQHFSAGDLMRSIGNQYGLDILQTNLAAEQREEFDHLVDQKLRDIGDEENKLVIDSRMAWHWIPDSFKVFLELDLEVAARRIIANTDAARLRHEHVPNDPEEYANILHERLKSEARRYKKLYDADPYDTKNYDLVVDTAIDPSDKVAAKIVSAYQKWLED